MAATIERVQQSDAQEEKCCYTHPDVAGVCEVTPNEEETCASILDYLNTPMSMGKTYC